MLQVKNLERFILSIQAEKARQQKRVTKAYKEYLAEAFQDLLMNTPQWSGQLAANWHIVLTNAGTAPTVDWYKKGHTGWAAAMPYKPAQRGDGEAVHTAWDRAAAQLEKVRWNTKVTFYNSDPNADQIELNAMTPPLRPVNLVNGTVAMAEYIRHKYTRMITLGP